MHRERIFRFCKATGRGNTGRISAGSTYTRPCGLQPRRKCRAYFKGRQRGKPQQSTSLRRIVLRLHCLSTNAVRNFDLACVEQHIGSALFPWSSSALRLKAAGPLYSRSKAVLASGRRGRGAGMHIRRSLPSHLKLKTASAIRTGAVFRLMMQTAPVRPQAGLI